MRVVGRQRTKQPIIVLLPHLGPNTPHSQQLIDSHSLPMSDTCKITRWHPYQLLALALEHLFCVGKIQKVSFQPSMHKNQDI
jgi:hypothetical protein